jgi:hypothetical protein
MKQFSAPRFFKSSKYLRFVVKRNCARKLYCDIDDKVTFPSKLIIRLNNYCAQNEFTGARAHCDANQVGANEQIDEGRIVGKVVEIIPSSGK